jgi:hypothetical protein
MCVAKGTVQYYVEESKKKIDKARDPYEKGYR